MSPASEDPLQKAIAILKESIERNVENAAKAADRLDRTLISLSAGALVFSTTLVATFAPAKLWLPLLFCAWACFIAALLFVIFAMRASQKGIESRILASAASAKRLEDHPEIARAFIKEKGGDTPITTTRIHPSAAVSRLNNCALWCFLFGVLLLAIFVGYNQWQTQSAQPKPQPLVTPKAEQVKPAP